MSKHTPRPVRINTDSLGGPIPCDQGQVRIDIVTDDDKVPTRARLTFIGFELVKNERENQVDVFMRMVNTYGGFRAVNGTTTEILIDVADKVAKNDEGLLPQLRALRHTAIGKLNSMHRQRTGDYKRPQAQNSPFDNAASRAGSRPERVTSAAEVEAGLRGYKLTRTR